MAGAGHLAAGAAQRAGARDGAASAPRAWTTIRRRPTEAIGLALPADGWAPRSLDDAARFGALVVGPGLGTAADTRRGVRAVAGGHRPAGACSTAMPSPSLGADAAAVLTGRTGATVLTPHDGEFAAARRSRSAG